MKNFVFGLILMLFTLSALPTQAYAPDDGVKKEVVYQDITTPIISVDLSIELPQVHFDEPCVFKDVDKWNNESLKTTSEFSILKNKDFSWRNINNLNFSTNLNFTSKYLHIDPGRKYLK